MQSTKRAPEPLGESSATAGASAPRAPGARAPQTGGGGEEAQAPIARTAAHALLLAERAAVGRTVSFDGSQYGAPPSPNALRDQLLSNLSTLHRSGSDASSTESIRGGRAAGRDAGGGSFAAACDPLAHKGSGGGTKGRLAELARDHAPSFDGNAPSSAAPSWCAGGKLSPNQRTPPRSPLSSPLSPRGPGSRRGSRRGMLHGSSESTPQHGSSLSSPDSQGSRRGSQRAVQHGSSQSAPKHGRSLSSPDASIGDAPVPSVAMPPRAVSASPPHSPTQSQWGRGRARTLSIEIDLTPVVFPPKDAPPLSPRIKSLLRDASATFDERSGEATYVSRGRTPPPSTPVSAGANAHSAAAARRSPLSPHSSFRVRTLDEACAEGRGAVDSLAVDSLAVEGAAPRPRAGPREPLISRR
jgi:hypothetical protein